MIKDIRMSAGDVEPRLHSTQRERVRDLLRSAGEDGLCSYSLYSLGLPNGRNRIVELRDDEGLDIETFECARWRHDPATPNHVRYRWWWNKPRQLALMDPIQIGRKEEA